MILAKVIGSVVATEKYRNIHSYKILLIQPINSDRTPLGPTELALDTVQAGVGDTVIVNQEGNSCRQMMNDPEAGVNAIACGIVDSIDMG